MRLPDENQIRDRVRELLRVDHIALVIAKKGALRTIGPGAVTHGPAAVEYIVREDFGLRDPGPVMTQGVPEFDWTHVTRRAEYISGQLAACEAIWSLLHTGHLIPGNLAVHQLRLAVSYGHPQGTSGSSGDIELRNITATVPVQVTLSPSMASGRVAALTDGDLYLRELNISNLHPLIDEALRQAVACFRHELFQPCLAMLTKALEGSWTELGVSLAQYADRAGDTSGQKKLAEYSDPFIKISRLIPGVHQYYKQKPLFDAVRKAAGLEPNAVDFAALWSDLVRDSRNVLHFANVPTFPLTYERVATLMVAATAHLQTLNTVKVAADRLP